MEDAKIIRLFASRSEEAIAQALQTHGRACRGTAARILASPEDVEECVNDAMLQAWQVIPPECPSNLGAFLVTITRNLALNRWKQEHCRKRGGGQVQLALEELSDCIHSAEDVEETIDQRLLVRTMEAFLDTLSADARTIFVQRYQAMLSVREIAEQYRVSESKVKVTLMRVRKRLRKYLKEEGWL